MTNDTDQRDPSIEQDRDLTQCW